MRKSDLFMDSSILYRSTQKYFDKKLQDFHLTYGQLPVLIMVYENEGVSLQEIAHQGVYDKGTITKNVQKLEALKLIEVRSSKKDKRFKELYTTPKAIPIMVEIYNLRKGWWKQLNASIPEEMSETFAMYFSQIVDNAKCLADENETKIQFYDYQKVSLNEYSDHISTILYTGGCNFQCPNCHRKDLVFLKQDKAEVPMIEIENYLEKRQKTIEAVSIKGGEPCMHQELAPFLVYVKSLGYKVLIETNGSYPNTLQEWIQEGYVDFVRLSIHNEPKFYEESIGIHPFDMKNIEKTIQILKSSSIAYEFIIRLDENLHNEQRIVNVAKWLHSDKDLCLDSSSFDSKIVEAWISKIQVYMPNVRIGESV